MKRHIITGVGILFTVVCLWWALRGIHFREIFTIVKDVSYVWVPGIVGATLLSIWLRAVRWKVMLDPITKVSVGQAYSATMIGFMANNVLPMRLGEVVRAYAIGKTANVSKSAAFATIVVERAFDLGALLLMLGLVLMRYSFDARFKVLGYIALGACVLMFVVMGLAVARGHIVERWVALMIKPLPASAQTTVNELFTKFMTGFEVLSRGHHVVQVSLLSILVWLGMAGSFWFTNLTFDLDLPVFSSVVMTVVCALGVMLPSGPAFVGTFELAAKYGLMQFRDADRLPIVSDEVAVSYALFYHVVQFVPLLLLGFYHLWRDNLSLSSAVEDRT